MFADKILLDTVDTSPLKKGTTKGKFVIKNDRGFFKKSIDSKVASFLFNLLIVSFWIHVINNLYHSKFQVFEEDSTALTLLFYAIGIVLTFINRSIKKRLKKEEYIDKKSGKIRLLGLKKKKRFKNIIGIQLLSYIGIARSYSRTSGVSKHEVLIYEINLITKRKKRIPLCLVENKKQEAFSIAEKLSVFFEKPLQVNLKETEEKEKEERVSQLLADTSVFNSISDFFNVSIDILISLKTFNTLQNRKEFEVTEIAENKFSLNTFDTNYSFLNIPKELKQIKATITLYKKTNSNTRAKIKTHFRFDSFLCLAYIVYFFYALFALDNNSTTRFFLSVFFVIALVRLFNIRSKKNEFVQEIIEILIPENEEEPSIKF